MGLLEHHGQPLPAVADAATGAAVNGEDAAQTGVYAGAGPQFSVSFTIYGAASASINGQLSRWRASH